MESSYKSEYPAGVSIDDGIVRFFEEFYKASDAPEAHEKYTTFYTDDAVLIMASKRCEGRDGEWMSLLFAHLTSSVTS
jgi:hypothetical protein